MESGIWIGMWLKAFALTCIVEVPIASVLFRHDEPKVARRIGLSFFAQLASHPLVWFVFAELPVESWWARIAVAEAWAVSSEIAFYVLAFKGVPWWRAAVVSVVANGASFGLGLLLQDALYSA